MLKKFWFLFLILLVEGASLMAVELMGAKLLAPFYGSSLYVWTAVLAITVLGLTLGYYFGGRLSADQATEKRLVVIVSIAALLVWLLPVTATALIALTAGMGLIVGICVASLFLLVPPMLCFGLVGPVTVRLMTQKMEGLGNVAGLVYFTSTLGGIAATFGFGFYWIPEAGLKFSALLTALALAVLPVIYLLKKRFVQERTALPEVDIPKSEPAKTVRVAKAKTATSRATQIKSPVYLFAVLEGASVMAVELMTARMLAPYFGASLYVWVAVIGITLFSLALGYFAGGRLADRFPRIETINWALLLAAAFLLIMHFAAQRLTLTFTAMDIRIAVVLVSVLLILPPLLFFGMIPTLLIRYVSAKADDAGVATGRVFAISSASGILALPLLGFWVIPSFGLAGPSILIGLLIGIGPFLQLLSQKKYAALLFPAVLLFSYAQRNKATTSPDLNVLSYSEGLLGQVLVADVFKNGAGAPANDRVLFVNRMGQTILDKNTNNARWNYIHFASAAASALRANADALLLGLGGGSVANVLQNNMQFNVDAVELDARIGKTAQKYFSLNPKVRVIIDDARHYLETTQKTYDLIFFDVFKGDIPPPHVLSLECFEKAKTLLRPGGLLIVNFNGFLSGDTGIPGRALYATLRAAGLHTQILPTPGPEEERNTLFLAAPQALDFRQLRSPLLHNGQPVALDSLFLPTAALGQQAAPVFTDDRPNLDRLVIPAAAIWRKGYNDTYTRFFLKNGVPLFH